MEENQPGLAEELDRLKLENKKLKRELRHISKDNEILRMANEQAVHAHEFIRQENVRQVFYIRQLLRTAPYLIILTDAKLNTVMTSDVYFQFGNCNRARIQSGVQLREAMEGILMEEALETFLENCRKTLQGEYVKSYLFRKDFLGRRMDLQVNIRSMRQDGVVNGLNITFVDMSQIVDAKERAEAADLAKSNFLANMSHEIRTPMNAISGMAQFIIRDSEDEEAKRHASMIQTASRTLLSIINDILDFSRIESGKLEIIEEDYHLSSLINDVAALIRIRLQDTQTELILDVVPDLPQVLHGDEVRIKQILTNIMGNAVKYTKEGSITLRIRQEKPDENHCRLMFSVKDTGVGIRKEDQDKLFSSFSRVDTRRNRSVEGSGLGLAISKELVEMMGGTIRVFSIYGEGSKFSFDIVNEVVDWSPMGEVGNRAVSVKPEAFRPTFRAPKARILVVDDNEMNLDVAKGLFHPYHSEVTCVLSGAEAMVSFASHDYDVVFIDHMMPGMDGEETMKKLRGMPGGGDMAMVMLTANAMSGAKAQYTAMGFQEFLSKPVDPAELDRILRRCLPKEKIQDVNPAGAFERNEPGESSSEAGMPGEEKGDPVRDLQALREIAELDVDRGLGYCINDPVFYLTTVFRFVRRAKDQVLEEQFGKRDWENYLITIHAVKGNLQTIGAEDASKEARELEVAIREDRMEYVTEHHEAFIRRYRALVEACRTVLSDQDLS